MTDKIIKSLIYDGKFSAIFIENTNMVEEARKIHNLSPVASIAFGKLLTIASLIGCEMKSIDDSLTIQLKSNGSIGTMVVVCDNVPKVRGYVVNPQVDSDLLEVGKFDVENAIGNTGFINVVKDIGLKKPYIGISPIISGNLSENFKNYFANSEQTNSIIDCDVVLEKNKVKRSVGYIIIPMPDATNEDIIKINKTVSNVKSFLELIEKEISLKEVEEAITGDNSIQLLEENNDLKYECNCSKERMYEAFKTIGKEEIEKILKEDGKAEVVCHFCNKKYNFDENDLKSMIQ